MFLSVAILLGGQASPAHPDQFGRTLNRQLPATTRPVSAPKFLRAADIVSVSEYATKEEPIPVRVFRYTFPGSEAAFVAKLKATLRKSDGWVYAPAKGREPTMFSRDPKTGKFVTQAFLIQPTRLVRDPKVEIGWRPLPRKQGEGWLWVSYNERLRPKR